MGLRIINHNADYRSSAASFSLPASDGLEFLHFMHQSLDHCIHNYAADKADGTLLGAPTLNAGGYLQCGALANGIETSMVESDAMTLFVVARSTATNADQANQPAFVSSYNGPAASDPTKTSAGVQIYPASSVVIGQLAARLNGTAAISAANAASNYTAGSWHLLVGRTQAANSRLESLTNTAVVDDDVSTYPRLRTSRKMRIGTSYATYAGNCDIALAGGWSRYLTNDEVAANAVPLRAYLLSAFGIAV